MIILTLLSLFLPFISTTPIPADGNPASPPNAIRIQAGQCLHVFGEHILLPDCHDALDQMRHHLDSIPGTHDYVGPFGSGGARNPLFTLPKIWRTPTCSIGLDLNAPWLVLPANWPKRVSAAENIVQQCVEPRAIGGEFFSEEFFVTVVINEQSMAPQMRGTWDRCLRAAGHPVPVPGTRCEGLVELAQQVIRGVYSPPTNVRARPP